MLTIEKAAKKYSTKEHGTDLMFDVDRWQSYKGFKKGVEFAQRWILVEKELPTEEGFYLVKCKTSFPKNCEVVVAEFYEDNKMFYSESSDYPIKDATHWRPIDLK